MPLCPVLDSILRDRQRRRLPDPRQGAMDTVQSQCIPNAQVVVLAFSVPLPRCRHRPQANAHWWPAQAQQLLDDELDRGYSRQ